MYTFTYDELAVVLTLVVVTGLGGVTTADPSNGFPGVIGPALSQQPTD